MSRSSALASKATGFLIAKIAALLAVGYRLDEIRNDITGATPASFEPTLDYVVVKIPRFAFEKFPEADARLTSTMKSVGEVMAIGGTFKEAWGKAWRGLEKSGADLGATYASARDDARRPPRRHRVALPSDRSGLRRRSQRGRGRGRLGDRSVVHRSARPGVRARRGLAGDTGPSLGRRTLLDAKRVGLSDARIAKETDRQSETSVTGARRSAWSRSSSPWTRAAGSSLRGRPISTRRTTRNRKWSPPHVLGS